jgi:hypothetical protein
MAKLLILASALALLGGATFLSPASCGGSSGGGYSAPSGTLR